MHALWLVNQLRFIVPVNPWKFRLSSELLYKRNRPQVFMVYRLINHAGFLEEHEKFFSNSPIHSRILIGSRLWSQSCSDDKNWLHFPAFSLTFVYFAVLFCFRCKFSFLEKPFESSLTVAWFFRTNHNSLQRIATNEIASFSIDNKVHQMPFFVFAKMGKCRLSRSKL